ncbi:hypothetical protein LTR36_009619 [Oleoguttula mirabilis]|uniref:Uncharacterized protein n=1 Tax=Oleoguttula mirabilis TaxID=1507867 RepID=A0AAV9J5Q0_9PEZI|nr:hypothetical protein LTR36_009619 [Oleoguttula mirabilis]
MCLFKVKEEEDYSVPARYKRVSRVRRYSPSPPPRVERVTCRSYVEERRPSAGYALPPPPMIIEPPPPEPSVRAETVRSRRTSRAPSVRAPSRVSVTQSHYVEVDEDDTSSSSSSSGAPSRATSHHTRKTARSAKAPSTAPPASEYSIHEREREIRRERRQSRPREDYETFRYVPAPPTESGRSRSRAGSGNFDPRASRESYTPRRETRVHIEDDGGRRDVRYRR